MSDRRSHWVRPNEANRYPRRLIVLDSEAETEWTKNRERHRLRCVVASCDSIDRVSLEPVKTEWHEGTDPAELWRWVDERTRSNERTVLFAHNLGYDVRLTAALVELPALGWELTAFSLDSYRCWARWRRGKRSLVMVDLFSFLPVGLEKVGTAVGLRKLRMPDRGAPIEKWLARCRRDVEITRAGVLQLLRWLETRDMGSFRLTGPAQASAAYRHRFMPRESLLVHDHSPAIAAERTSAWSGRCELWQHGRIDGYLWEWDYRLAYAHLARHLDLPVRFKGCTYTTDPDKLQRLGESHALLYEGVAATEVPTVPTSHEDRIVWPVGRFPTILWDVERDLLLAEGGTFEVRRTWLYQREPALAGWAEWIVAALDGPDPEADPLARIMLKSWSRSLIGRFGLRYPLLSPIATAPHADVLYAPQLDHRTGDVGYTLQVGREVLERRGAVEGRDSMPAVMAYVMAAARVRLWRAMQLAGTENVAYVDTDSLLVNAEGSRRLQAIAGEGEHVGLRVKRRHHGVELIAPRVVVTDVGPKIAGLPRGAERAGARKWWAEVWESPQASIRKRRPSEVVVERRLYQIKTKDHRRRHVSSGDTAPIRLDTGDDPLSLRNG